MAWLGEGRAMSDLGDRLIPASDVPKILGLHPGRGCTGWEIWCEQAFDVEPEKPRDHDMHAIMLPCLLDVASQHLGEFVAKLPTVTEFPIVAAGHGTTADLVFTKLVHRPEEWRAAPPAWAIARYQIAMRLHKAETSWIVAALPWWELRMHRVDYDEAYAAELFERAKAWHTEHFVNGVEPARLEPPRGDIVKRIRRKPGEECEIPNELVSRLEEARDTASRAKKAADDAKAQVLAHMKTATVGRVPDGPTVSLDRNARGSLLVNIQR
jgi:hypothetical protein